VTRPALARAALLLAGGALVLGAAEVALRVAYLGPSRALARPWHEPAPWSAIRTLDAQGAPWPRPHGRARWGLHPWSEAIEYRLDGSGLRGDAAVAARTGHDACRVLVAGDSNAFGYGVHEAEALPARLDAALARVGVPASVANGGICGSNVRQQRRWLEQALPGLAPDVLLVAVSPWSLRVDHGPQPAATLPDRLWNVVARPLRRAGRASAALDRGYRRLGHAAHDALGWPPATAVAWELAPLVEPPSAFAGRLAAAARELAAVADLARAQGVAPLLVFVPLDVQVSRERNRLYAEERLPYPAFGFVDRDYTRDARYGALRGVARAIEAPLVDATGVLRAHAADGYLPDDYHLSPAGHAHVARAAAPAVAAACRERRPRAAAGPLVARRSAP
jgi:lysophospholipase L1-like esterase